MPLDSLALTGWVDGHWPPTGSNHAAPTWADAWRATGGSVLHGSRSGSGASAARRARATTNPIPMRTASNSKRRRMAIHCGAPLDGIGGACEHAWDMRPATILLLM